MCGIAGILRKDGRPVEESALRLMASRMAHRGPDAEGLWKRGSVGFSHTRLKIIDLSDAANQPFTDGEDVLVFNGEIFNFQALRAELAPSRPFHTSSDTEVLFQALKSWDVDALSRVSGQFAFAFYRARDNSVLLARDHVGICPLYCLETDTELLFASEISPLLALRKCPVSRQGVVDYLTYRYNIQNGNTLFEGIRRFQPASWQKIFCGAGTRSCGRYWSLGTPQALGAEQDLQPAFDELLAKEVQEQRIADVPVGLYLSGGIDSGALLTAFARSDTAFKTYTLAFSDTDADVQQVKRLRQKYTFESNIIDFTQHSLDQLEDVVGALEEPFGDLIICANYQLASEASRQVKVVLSGEGGDETFMGYDHQRAFFKMLALSRSGAGSMARCLLPLVPPRVLAYFNNYPGFFGADEKSRVVNTYCSLADPSTAYLNLVRLFDPAQLSGLLAPAFLNGNLPEPDTTPIRRIFEEEDSVWRAVYRTEIEQLNLICNLIKHDRLTMHFSLEGRVPLLGRSILSFASSLPERMLVSKINKEYLLRYSGAGRIRKAPFSLFSSPMYRKLIANMLDRYLTRNSVEESGIFAWDAVSGLSKGMETCGILGAKRAMAILVLMVWWKRFRHVLA